jgi:hypothetical protein
MIIIRIGTRTAVADRLVGASNLDIGTYRDAGGVTRTGPTMTLTIPDAPDAAAIVGAGSQVRIGQDDYLVTEVIVGDTLADCEIHLVPGPGRVSK